MSSNRHWLCRCSSRWEQEVDPLAWDRLLLNPDLEAFKVKLAALALPLVEAQAQAQSNKQPGDHSPLVENAGKLNLIRQLFLLIDP